MLHAILTFDTRVVTRCPRAPGAEKRDEMLYIIVECATYLSNVAASMFVIGDVLGCATGGLFADR